MLNSRLRLMTFCFLITLLHSYGCGATKSPKSILMDKAKAKGAGAKIVSILSIQPDSGTQQTQVGLITGPVGGQKVYLIECKDDAGNTRAEEVDKFVRSIGYPLDLIKPTEIDQNTEEGRAKLKSWGYGEQPVLDCDAGKKGAKLIRILYSDGAKIFASFPDSNNSKALYHLGCSELATGLGLSLDKASAVDQSMIGTFIQTDDTFDLSCISGSVIASQSSFVESCRKEDSNAGSPEWSTYYALFDAVGVSNPDACGKVEAKLAEVGGVVNLAEKNLTNVAPLSTLKIKTLDLSFNSIEDATPLSRIGSLTSLNLDGNGLTASSIDSLKALSVSTLKLDMVPFDWSLGTQTFYLNCLFRDRLPGAERKTVEQMIRALGFKVDDASKPLSCQQVHKVISNRKSLDLSLFKFLVKTEAEKELPDRCLLPSILASLASSVQIKDIVLDFNSCEFTDADVAPVVPLFARNVSVDLRNNKLSKIADWELIAFDSKKVFISSSVLRLGGNDIIPEYCPVVSNNKSVNDFCLTLMPYVKYCKSGIPELYDSPLMKMLNSNVVDLNLSCEERFQKFLYPRTLLWITSEVTDLNPLRGLSNLEVIESESTDNWPGANDIDFTPIGYLHNLRRLSLLYLPVSNIRGIETLINLERLTLNTRIDELSPLLSLRSLKDLSILSGVKNLDTLANLDKLEFLWVTSSELVDIKAIRNMRNLKSVYFNSSILTDLTPLTTPLKLEALTIAQGRSIRDFSVFANFRSLKKLVLLTVPNLDRLEPFSKLTNLEDLSLDIRMYSDCETFKSNPLLAKQCPQ